MTRSLGLDIGGTKIAGAAFDEEGRALSQASLETPRTYESFLDACRSVVVRIEETSGKADSVGVGICGFFERATGRMQGVSNIPFLEGKPLSSDLEQILGREITFENDANCAALAEAVEGSGKGYRSVFCLILGTGVGGGFVFNGHVMTGANGLCGEIGHLPLPCREESEGVVGKCGCGRTGCIEQFISGPALARLYNDQTGKDAEAKQIAALAEKGDAEALKTMDKYYDLVAKAMTTVLHSFDPDIITVSGGLSALPQLYAEVPKRWGQYALCKRPATKFVPASFGPTAGLRGAALLRQ